MLPAYAGMIPAAAAVGAAQPRAPRVCGDDPRLDAVVPAVDRCSPRMRG